MRVAAVAFAAADVASALAVLVRLADRQAGGLHDHAAVRRPAHRAARAVHRRRGTPTRAPGAGAARELASVARAGVAAIERWGGAAARIVGVAHFAGDGRVSRRPSLP